MNTYSKTVELRWSDVDANQHVMHSKYYELGAHTRMSFLLAHGYTTELMRELKVGPILFREECIFRRELHAGEVVTVTMLLSKCRRDGSRWSVRHEILKADGTVAAVMNADLAWMDVIERKLAAPPVAAELMTKMPKADDFLFED
ncbi:MAG: acyl-CoA thioesterase [Chitinophagaceae bacterium]|nr:acyl-CoA thioesterase [Chitinophagaceae bacterium]